MNELTRLTAALCDGEISASEAARLEELASRSEGAKKLFIEYLNLHGELYWEHFAERLEHTDTKRPNENVWAKVSIFSKATAASWLIATMVTAFASCGLLVVVLLIAFQLDDVVAQVTQTVDAEWSSDIVGGELRLGQQLELSKGLAQITYKTGVSVILESPITFRLDGENCGAITTGSLTANVPAEAVGFEIRTPNASIVDLGTEFGVAVLKNGNSHVEVFRGRVDVTPVEGETVVDLKTTVEAGQVVRVSGATPQINLIARASHQFVRTLSKRKSELLAGSVAEFRKIVATNARLIHHFTFEGKTTEEKTKDKRGNLHLGEVVMYAGRGDESKNVAGKVDYSTQGVDATTNAVKTFRAKTQGNIHGVALQSADVFVPPNDITVELLVRYEGRDTENGGMVAGAVATRKDRQNCGFFITAGDEAELVHLMDGMESWVDGNVRLDVGDWYYIASTFHVDAGKTIINTYVANLSRGQRVLKWVVKNKATKGVSAASRLGIGKAFDDEIAHAYPWPGSLDEVAIYDAVLDRKSLQRHLEAIAGPPQSLEEEVDPVLPGVDSATSVTSR